MENPDIGDVVHIKPKVPSVHADAFGVVSHTRSGDAVCWTAVEVIVAGQRRWFDRDAIDFVCTERNPFRRAAKANVLTCRLHVVLARNAPRGVIFRRGPSGWVQLINWETSNDKFEGGQWFHGRLYEQRADLSPNGSLLIYFAAKPPGRPDPESGYSYAWTAISRPPYLTALALWPKLCSGTYFGGGLFVDDTHVLLNHLAGESDAHARPNLGQQRSPPKARATNVLTSVANAGDN